MSELIIITTREFDGEIVQTVNARDLWIFLESKQDFSTWIKGRIEKFGFVEGGDYLLHKFMEQLPSGAKSKVDYHLTLDMSKELAMVENNAKGREVRRYFIDCERQAKEAHAQQRMAANPERGRIPAHEADRIVAASRTFNALLRSSQAARIPLPTALRRAAEVALRETGIDILVELKAESHMADLDAKAAARAKASMVPDWVDDAPQSPAHFWQMWSNGQLEVPFQSCTSAQAYQAYNKWCYLTGQAFTVRHTQFTPLLQRAAAEAGSPVHVKPMNLGEAGNYRTERMLLISRPPDESQGAWATALARQFEAPLRVYLAQKRCKHAY